MPQLHLPTSHQPADLVLAHRIAEAVESSELYVVWSHDAGAGQRPEVRAEVREEPSVLVEALASIFNWVSTALSLLAAPREPEPPGPTPTAPREVSAPPEAAA